MKPLQPSPATVSEYRAQSCVSPARTSESSNTYSESSNTYGESSNTYSESSNTYGESSNTHGKSSNTYGEYQKTYLRYPEINGRHYKGYDNDNEIYGKAVIPQYKLNNCEL
jgi:hypothetical protein